MQFLKCKKNDIFFMFYFQDNLVFKVIFLFCFDLAMKEFDVISSKSENVSVGQASCFKTVADQLEFFLEICYFFIFLTIRKFSKVTFNSRISSKLESTKAPISRVFK